MNKRASFIIILRCGFVTRKKLPTKVKKVVNIYKDKNLYSWKWIPSSFYFFNFIFGKYLLVLNKIGVDQTLLMSHYSKLPLVWFKWRFHFYNHLFFERHLLEHTFIKVMSCRTYIAKMNQYFEGSMGTHIVNGLKTN